MLEQRQEPFTFSLLIALVKHPAFQQGVCQAEECYFDSYEESPLTEEEMTQEVEGNLTHLVTEQDQRLAQATGLQAASYLERLGWVVGTIAKGLTYVS